MSVAWIALFLVHFVSYWFLVLVFTPLVVYEACWALASLSFFSFVCVWSNEDDDVAGSMPSFLRVTPDDIYNPHTIRSIYINMDWLE